MWSIMGSSLRKYLLLDDPLLLLMEIATVGFSLFLSYQSRQNVSCFYLHLGKFLLNLQHALCKHVILLFSTHTLVPILNFPSQISPLVESTSFSSMKSSSELCSSDLDFFWDSIMDIMSRFRGRCSDTTVMYQIRSLAHQAKDTRKNKQTTSNTRLGSREVEKSQLDPNQHKDMICSGNI